MTEKKKKVRRKKHKTRRKETKIIIKNKGGWGGKNITNDDLISYQLIYISIKLTMDIASYKLSVTHNEIQEK